jgi:hypothetical protein
LIDMVGRPFLDPPPTAPQPKVVKTASPEEKGFKSCPKCGCLFLTDADLKTHEKAFGNHDKKSFERLHERLEFGGGDEDAPSNRSDIWKHGQWGDYALAVKDPFLVKLCQQSTGWVQCGMFDYHLSQDGKWLNKRITQNK